jgi:hypothetical protein
VRSRDKEELSRALDAAVAALVAELERTDPALAASLRPTLEALTDRQTAAFAVSS